MSERDMMYGGYYQNIPGNIGYGNFGFQGCPGSLMNSNMLPNMMGSYQNPNFTGQSSTYNDTIDINTRLNNLETRVRLLEQKLGNNNNSYQDDNSMYMI